MKRYTTEIVIVGAGLAGIIAALELLSGGKKVTLVDRDILDNLGGLARWAFGGMFFVNTRHQRKAGIQDSIDLALQDWYSYADFEAEEVWGKKWADQYVHLCTHHGYQWLLNQGGSFFPVVGWVERGLLVPGNSVPRFHMFWGTGQHLMRILTNRLYQHPKAKNLQILSEHRVTELITNYKEEVSGINGMVEHSGDRFHVEAEIVLIASGGINGSLEKVRSNWYKPWGNPPKKILNGAHQFAIGDLHDATEQVNGHVVNLNKQWNYAAGISHYAPRKPNHGLSLVPSKSALWLNYEGRRFGPMPLVTPFDTRHLVQRICQEPVKYSWQILNRKIAYKEFAISGAEHMGAFRDRKWLKFIWQTLVSGNKMLVNNILNKCTADIVTAPSVETLVRKMNTLTDENSVKLKYVQQAIENYDGEIDKGPSFHNDEQLRRIAQVRQYRGDRVRTCKFQKIVDPRAMPLIAIRTHILSRKSLGGIQTDLQGKVLSKPDILGNQKPIPGLYAIGEAAGFGGGGMHGHRSLEGTFLGGCIITARVAALDILGKKLE